MRANINFPTPRQLKAFSVGGKVGGGYMATFTTYERAEFGKHILEEWGGLDVSNVYRSTKTGKFLVDFYVRRISKGSSMVNPRFTVYAGDRKYAVPSDNLKSAFDAAKTFSKYQGESYLYDKNVDKMIAHFVAGIRTQEGKQTDASRGIKYQRKGPMINPRGNRTLIYGQVNRIIATKKQQHICDAECKRHGHRYFHDFTSKPKMYGLPNGDLLITTR